MLTALATVYLAGFALHVWANRDLLSSEPRYVFRVAFAWPWCLWRLWRSNVTDGRTES